MSEMLERNLDNLTKTLTGLAKYQLTQGEAVNNGFYYYGFASNLACRDRPFSRSWITRSDTGAASTPGSRPTPSARAPTSRSFLATAFPEVPDDRVRAPGQEAHRHRRGGGGAGRCRFRLSTKNLLSPKTIIAYFTSATAIYPGDESGVVGVRVGTIDAIEPRGHPHQGHAASGSYVP